MRVCSCTQSLSLILSRTINQLNMQTAWKEYQDKNQQRFLDEMLELLRIPSVSAKSENKEDMRRCAELVRKRMIDSGAGKAEVMETAGHPVVYAEKIIDPSKPTVLVYGH